MTNEINKRKFFSRSYCSGLFSSLFILPNGKVTMCEELYWYPKFNPNWSLEFSPFNFLMTAIRKCCLYTVVYQ